MADANSEAGHASSTEAASTRTTTTSTSAALVSAADSSLQSSQTSNFNAVGYTVSSHSASTAQTVQGAQERRKRRAAEPLKYVLRLSGFETLKDKGYTVYFVRVAVESCDEALKDGQQRLWYIRKRYRDFWHVQQEIQRRNGAAPHLPQKKYFGNLNPEFVKLRAHGLSVFLWELAASPALCALRPVHEFLWSNVCVPPTRSMLPSTPLIGSKQSANDDQFTESMAAFNIDDDSQDMEQLYRLDARLSPPPSPAVKPGRTRNPSLSEQDLVRQATSDIADVQGRIILTSCEDLQRSFAREGIYLPEEDLVESDAHESDQEDSGIIVKACSNFMPGIYKWYAGQPAANLEGEVDENMDIEQKRQGLRTLGSSLDLGDLYINSSTQEEATRKTKTSLIPKLRFVIVVVGSRGDVQPYVALGMALRRRGHYVRIAAHECFREFVKEAQLGFAPLAGDPKELLRMVTENSMFSYSFVREGVASHRTWISQILDDAWDACTLPEEELRSGPEIGPRPPRESVRTSVGEGPGVAFAARKSSFRADVVIANPPSFSGWHIAEALGVPLYMSFPMPWSRTTAFPSPFTSTEGESSSGRLNWLSYGAVDRLIWLGAGDLINRWRVQTLRLPPIWTMSARGHRIAHDNRVPTLYPWSPQMLPKPKDWGSHICIPGYWFLDDEMAKEKEPPKYDPPAPLAEFLAADPGNAPIFIGFGSIVVTDPQRLSKIIADTLRAMSGSHRFIVQAGWADVNVEGLLSASSKGNRVLQIGAVPHRWLFERCKCVIHHGGAGTTAEGLRAGKPTVVVPFFGDQFFWAKQVETVRVGVRLPYSKLSAKRLCIAIEKALGTGMRMRAQVMAASIARENGTDEAIAFIERRFLRMEAVRGTEIMLRHLPSLQVDNDEDCRSSGNRLMEDVVTEEGWTKKNIERDDFWRYWPYVNANDQAKDSMPGPLRAINSIGRQIRIAGSVLRDTVGRADLTGGLRRGNLQDVAWPSVELKQWPNSQDLDAIKSSPRQQRHLPSVTFASRIPPGHTQYSWRAEPENMVGHTKYSAGLSSN